MGNLEKYAKVFADVLGVEEPELSSLRYQHHPNWDSVGHMRLIEELEDVFNIMFSTDDIVGFSSYEKGKEILSKGEYGVIF